MNQLLQKDVILSNSFTLWKVTVTIVSYLMLI